MNNFSCVLSPSYGEILVPNVGWVADAQVRVLKKVGKGACIYQSRVPWHLGSPAEFTIDLIAGIASVPTPVGEAPIASTKVDNFSELAPTTFFDALPNGRYHLRRSVYLASIEV